MTRGYAIQDGEACVLKLDGHASGDEKVCAGISTLVQTLQGWIANNKSHVYSVRAMDIGPGRVKIVYSTSEWGVEAFRVICFGLAQLAHNNPAVFSMELDKKQ